MILAVDIGNTHILLGGFDDQEILFTELLTTNRHATDLEYAALIETALRVNRLDFTTVDGAIVSSVVPSVTNNIRTAIERFTGVTVKSRMLPLALSCIISRFAQNETVTQETASSAEIS